MTIAGRSPIGTISSAKAAAAPNEAHSKVNERQGKADQERIGSNRSHIARGSMHGRDGRLPQPFLFDPWGASHGERVRIRTRDCMAGQDQLAGP
jgi:hypothetical protein